MARLLIGATLVLLSLFFRESAEKVICAQKNGHNEITHSDGDVTLFTRHKIYTRRGTARTTCNSTVHAGFVLVYACRIGSRIPALRAGTKSKHRMTNRRIKVIKRKCTHVNERSCTSRVPEQGAHCIQHVHTHCTPVACGLHEWRRGCVCLREEILERTEK